MLVVVLDPCWWACWIHVGGRARSIFVGVLDPCVSEFVFSDTLGFIVYVVRTYICT